VRQRHCRRSWAPRQSVFFGHTPLEQACQPSDVLVSLNDRVHAARLDTPFVAMLYATYDADNRRLAISNAGNSYPLVLRDRKIDKRQVAGVPLGLLLSGLHYETLSLDLQPGDVVLLASDGILENHNGGTKRVRVRIALPGLSVPRLPKASAQEISSSDSLCHG
jgi:serine phosphatase RsbU (regulator of sigma subunit)